MSQCPSNGYAYASCPAPPPPPSYGSGTLPFTGFELWLVVGVVATIFALAAIAASASRR